MTFTKQFYIYKMMHNHTSFVVVMHIYIIIIISLGNNDSFINIFYRIR